MFFFFFFFSSRRRHTRFDCDWSSDVCSSDLLACRLGAKFFVQGSVAYVGPTVTLQATLYEGGRARRSAKAEGRVGAEESEMMDRVWTGLYPEFTPGADATLPNGGPEALAAYLNAEAA